jgi:AcrB/AcrD/AcrF family
LIDRLIAVSIRHRVIVIVLSLVFVVLGAMASTRVPIDAVPDVTNVQVQVITAAPALGPVDVETYVTTPVERTMAGLPGLDQIRSISRAGISVVTLAFGDSTDMWFARNLVNERLAQARAEVPSEYGTPALGPASSGLGEVLHFEVKGEGVSLMERRSTLEWIIGPRLRLVPGVVEVNTFGGEAKSLEITLDPQKMATPRWASPRSSPRSRRTTSPPAARTWSTVARTSPCAVKAACARPRSSAPSWSIRTSPWAASRRRSTCVISATCTRRRWSATAPSRATAARTRA